VLGNELLGRSLVLVLTIDLPSIRFLVRELLLHTHGLLSHADWSCLWRVIREVGRLVSARTALDGCLLWLAPSTDGKR